MYGIAVRGLGDQISDDKKTDCLIDDMGFKISVFRDFVNFERCRTFSESIKNTSLFFIFWLDRRSARCVFSKAKTFENIIGFCNKFGTRANERMRANEVRVGDRAGNDKNHSVLLDCKASGRERPRPLRRFDNEDALRKTAHDTVSLEKAIGQGRTPWRIFGENRSARFENIPRQVFIETRIDEIGPGGKHGDCRIAARKRTFMRGGIRAESESAYDTATTFSKRSSKAFGKFLPRWCYLARANDREKRFFLGW